ncbi:MAG: pentapeptide repeat-containing protein [Deltaproteobacteria bacterium]|nr:pentapeptide repeat-containing protein [Deltaproteobacteria bacterium]
MKQHAAWVNDGGLDNLDDPKVVNDPRRANLCGANLHGATLSDADLEDVDLIRAQVSKAKLAYVTLTDATYAPVSEPPDSYVAGIDSLATIKAASGDEIGLIQLRKLLEDAGLRDGVRR